MRDKPTSSELLKLGLLLLHFLFLGFRMYVDDLWLTCRLLLDENDIVVVIVLGLGLGHVRHSGRCRDHLRLLLLLRWIVCGYQYGKSIPAPGGEGYGAYEAGG
jgi:hypothetical protein